MGSSLGLSLEWQGKELEEKLIAMKKIASVRESNHGLVNTVGPHRAVISEKVVLWLASQ